MFPSIIFALSMQIGASSAGTMEEVVVGGDVLMQDGQRITIEYVNWPPGDLHEVLAGWNHVLRLGDLAWENDVLTVAGLPVDELLVLQGSAIPASHAPDRVWRNHRDGLYGVSGNRQTTGFGQSSIKFHHSASGRVYSYPIQDGIEIQQQDGEMALSGAFSNGTAWSVAPLYDVSKPFSLTVDGHSYSPVVFDGYENNTLFISSGLNLNCQSAGNPETRLPANIVAMIDNRVLLLDGSQDALMPTFTRRPDGGYNLVLSSMDGDTICGSPDAPFWIYGDRFDTVALTDPYQPLIPSVVDAEIVLDMFSVQVTTSGFQIRWNARNAGGCWVPQESTLPIWSGAKTVKGYEAATPPFGIAPGAYQVAMECGAQPAAVATSIITVQ